MKTAEEVAKGMRLRYDEMDVDSIKDYAKQVAEQALKDAADSCSETEDKRGEHSSMIREIEIITP